MFVLGRESAQKVRECESFIKASDRVTAVRVWLLLGASTELGV